MSREVRNWGKWRLINSDKHRSQRGWGLKNPLDFPKKVYSDLRKHGFSKLLPMSIYHQEQIMKTTTDWHKSGNTKGKNRRHRREERWRDQCTLLSLTHNTGFISALKNIPTAMRSSKIFSHITWERHKGVSHADGKWHSSIWGPLLHLCLVPRVQATTLFISCSVMQTTSSAGCEAVSNMWKRSDFSVKLLFPSKKLIIGNLL